MVVDRLVLLLLLLFPKRSNLCFAFDREKVLEAIALKESSILALYGNRLPRSDFESAEYFTESARSELVKRMSSALRSGKFHVAVGGMSDVAGHGNLFEESYPRVLEDAAREVFETAGIDFRSSNLAMGGVPSFPSSACMAEWDADVIVWDFRMVERDEIKGEMFLRQSLMAGALVCFKRKNNYLKQLRYAHPYVHVLDEMHVYNVLQKKQSPGVLSDRFCQSACDCPGQVRWHAGWKMQRFRGLHMALFYFGLLKQAVEQPQLTASSLQLTHPPVSKHCKDLFCSRQYSCAMSWAPRIGPDLTDLVDGTTNWRLQHASRRAAELTRQGHSKCGYKDEKKSLVGDVSSHWLFFNLKDVKDTVAFCGDFASKDFASYALIVVNQEEVMEKLEPWLESKTLGVASACFSTSHNVSPNTILGFRVTSGSLTIALTHVLWH